MTRTEAIFSVVCVAAVKRRRCKRVEIGGNVLLATASHDNQALTLCCARLCDINCRLLSSGLLFSVKKAAEDKEEAAV